MSEKEINYEMLANSGYLVQELSAGESIFEEGDPGDTMYIVRSGEVEIARWKGDCGGRAERYFRRNGAY